LGAGRKTIKVNFEKLVAEAKAELATLLAELGVSWGEGWNTAFGPGSAFENAWKNLGTQIKAIWTFNVLPVIKGLWNDFANQIGLPTWEEITKVWTSEPSDGVLTNLQQTWDLFKASIEANGGLLTTIGEIGATILTWMMQGISNAWNEKGAVAARNELWGNFKAWGMELIEGMVMGISQKILEIYAAPYVTYLNLVRSWFGLDAIESSKFFIVGGEVITGFARGVASILAGVMQAGGTIYNAFVGFISSVRGLLFGNSDAGNPFVAIGQTMISSIIGSLAGGIATVGSALYNLVMAAIQWMKDKMGWHSPAPQFVDLGKNIAASIAYGISSGAGMIGGALTNAMNPRMHGAMGSSMAMAPVYGGNTNNVSFGDVNLNSSMDFAMFRSMVQKVITE
jgi:hypothetical protein